MASKDTKSTTENLTSVKPANEDRNVSPASAQDQTLLKALQDLIVWVTDPKQANDHNQTYLGPEAGNLIASLQKFILSIVVSSQSRSPNTMIKVNLDKEDKEFLRGDLEDKDFPGSESDLVSNKESTQEEENKLVTGDVEDSGLHGGEYDIGDHEEGMRILVEPPSPEGGRDKSGDNNTKHPKDNELRRDNVEANEFPGGGSDLVGEEESAYEENDPQEDENDLSDGEEEVGISVELPSSESGSDKSWENNPRHLAVWRNSPEPIFQEKLLRALREHVFNKMPIRLLCFEPHESDFRISLYERAAIFERLALEIQVKMREEEFRPLKWRHLAEEEVVRRLIPKYTRYAILSHTWLHTVSGEVTHSDWNEGNFNSKGLGYRKLVNFCKVAWIDHQLTFGWMDTVCINKDSSSELDESIRSMYNWYERAAVCITYLAETETLASMQFDPWFTRGWTLQELFAPGVIKFYNKHWGHLVDHSDNDKTDRKITKEIKRATTISKDELKNIREAPISRRMQLAATREVTREEDMAYSLMGIFGISISTAYGEGAERAFLRLLQEIIASSKHALDILNWAGDFFFSHPYNPSAVLPTSPDCYINRSLKGSLNITQPVEPLTVSHLGLRVPVILMPGISIWDVTSQHDPIGDYTATVNISPTENYSHVPTTYRLLDNKISGRDGWSIHSRWYQTTFAIFNFTGAGNITSLRKTCIAVGLQCHEPAGKVSHSGGFEIIRTNRPIVFELSKKTAVDPNTPGTEDWDGKIPTDELAEHGMQLISLYMYSQTSYNP